MTLMKSEHARELGISLYGDHDAPAFERLVAASSGDWVAVRDDRFPTIAAQVGQEAVAAAFEGQEPSAASA